MDSLSEKGHRPSIALLLKYSIILQANTKPNFLATFLPKVQKIEIRWKNRIFLHTKEFSIAAFWIEDAFDKYFRHFSSFPSSCKSDVPSNCQHQTTPCWTLSNKNSSVRNVLFLTNTLKSWHQASELCNCVGGYLPILRSRNELHELVALLKLSPVHIISEALFVGSDHEVS